jgi:xylose dehydrogenase (NAD/NADP)
MKPPIRWGLLSTANINRRLIPAIHASERGKLTAVASRNKQTAEAYAQKWEIPVSFGSYEAMLASDQVDAVYISLPNHLHAEWSIRALQAGKHVLCEKPLALTVEEVDQMIDASRTAHCVLAEAFMYRHHPQTKLAGEIVHSGKIGEVCAVSSTFSFSISSRENIRLVKGFGGGSLWDVGVYPVSFAQFIMGAAPEQVMGYQWLGESGVDETFTGILRYSGSRLANITSSFRSPFHTRSEILGTQGRLELTRPFIGLQEGGRMILYDDQGEEQDIRVPDKELYLGEIEDMHAAILDQQPNYLDLHQSRDHIQTIQALYQAAQSSQTVTL